MHINTIGFEIKHVYFIIYVHIYRAQWTILTKKLCIGLIISVLYVKFSHLKCFVDIALSCLGSLTGMHVILSIRNWMKVKFYYNENKRFRSFTVEYQSVVVPLPWHPKVNSFNALNISNNCIFKKWYSVKLLSHCNHWAHTYIYIYSATLNI